jgi:hypothetical protein
MTTKLLSIDTNAKTVKGQKKGFLTGILYLAPSDASGLINTCKWASKGCRMACLYSAGRGRFNSVKQARIRKTIDFVQNQAAFLLQLSKDIDALKKKADKLGLIPCVRLNGTSDINWHDIKAGDYESIFHAHPDISFYDYTKNIGKVQFLSRNPIKNYHLTFSRSESNNDACNAALSAGVNVAAVFKDVPETWQGFPVINGDESDFRFLDPSGVIVGLKAKGDAKKDTSGFVI